MALEKQHTPIGDAPGSDEIASRVLSLPNRNWLLGLVFVVTVAAVVGATLVVWPPDTTLRTVAIVGSDPLATTPNERVDFIQNLQAAAGAEAILVGLAATAELSTEELTSRLRVERLAESTLSRVVYETSESDPEIAIEIVTQLPLVAVDLFRSSELSAADASVGAAQEDVDVAESNLANAESALQDAMAASGGASPEDQLAVLQQEVADLRVRRASTDPNDPETEPILEQLDAAIIDAETQIAEISGTVPSFRSLERSLERAEVEWEQATAVLQSALSSRSELAIDPTVSIQAVEEEVSQVGKSLQWIVLAGVAAFGLSTLIAFWWATGASVGARRRGRRKSSEV